MCLPSNFLTKKAISPIIELGAYEALWKRKSSTFKTLAEKFKENPTALPSDFVSQQEINETLQQLFSIISETQLLEYGVSMHGAFDYPTFLKDDKTPISFLYYQGNWDLLFAPKRISVIGTRKPSDAGKKRARKLVKLLVNEGYTIFSGLAAGIDTIAHKTAIEVGGNTVAVLGTDILSSYPKNNKELQSFIAKNHLVVSQVPILRFRGLPPKETRFLFPARNATMSALSQASVIVEAGETSGTRIQAHAALSQGRKLFILDNCFHNENVTWPHKLKEQGAIQVKTIDDILTVLDGNQHIK